MYDSTSRAVRRCHSGARAVRAHGRALTVITLAIALAACGSDSTRPDTSQEVDGPAVDVGNGTAQSYVLQRGNSVTAVGIKLSDGALDALPADLAQWDLPMPAGISARPWDHAMLNWNPQGHPPPQIYGVPHFDFHFYVIPEATQMAIPGGEDNSPVDPQFVPTDYASQIESVPQMGVHWADTLASEYHGVPFTRTFIYGFYQGQMVFVEPMITLEYLRSHPDVSALVKQPAAFQQPGAYPTSYAVHYDATQHATYIELDSLAVH